MAIGSAVRPNAPNVDIDLVALCEDHAKLDAKPPVEVDLRAYLAGEVETLLKQGNDLLAWSLQLGVLLFERDSFWTTMAGRWQERIPLPSPQVARSRAEVSLRRVQELLAVAMNRPLPSRHSRI